MSQSTTFCENLCFFFEMLKQLHFVQIDAILGRNVKISNIL